MFLQPQLMDVVAECSYDALGQFFVHVFIIAQVWNYAQKDFTKRLFMYTAKPQLALDSETILFRT
jgi:hypothetical protein